MHKVNHRKYRPRRSGYSFIKSLYEIKLAIEAISVPSPPILQPTINSLHWSVNPDKSNAAGTLLMS